MSILKKTGGRFAALAVAAGLVVGGALAATPAYASPENPVAPKLVALEGATSVPYLDEPITDLSELPSVVASNGEVTLSGTGEPGFTMRVLTITKYLESDAAVNTQLYITVAGDGTWSARFPVASGMVGVQLHQYKESLEEVEEACGQGFDRACGLSGEQIVVEGLFVVADADVDVPVIAPLVGGAAALAGLVGLGAFGIRRKLNA